MSEVHRYKAVKMLSEAGNRITYSPHGPDVVMAEAYDQLKTENERLASVIQAVINEVPSRVTRNDGNAPGHCHVVPGIWDEDNGDRAGTECGWCKVWAAAVTISKERGQ